MNRHERRAAAKRSKINLGDPTANSPAALHEAGLRHLQAGHPLEAQLCCQQALATNPEHADSLHLMGLLSLQARQYDHAVEWLVRAIAQAPKAEYLASLGAALQQQGRRDDALKAFESAVQLKPDDAGLWRQLGDVLLELERPDDALRGYEQVLKLNPRDWDAACRSGIVLYQSGRLEEALARFNLCDQLRPNHAPTLYMRAVFLRDLKRFDEALADNRRAHALDPTNADTCNNIGSILQSLGRYEEALQWFDRALALRPNFVEARFNKAASLGKLRRIDEAFAVYQQIKAVGPTDAVTDSHLALLLYELGRFEEALVHFNRCDQQHPNHAPTLSMRAQTLRRLKRLDEALADSRRAYALDPASADACNCVGAVLQGLDRDEESLQWFDRALALRPDYVDALYNKAVSLSQVRRFDEAFAIYNRLKTLDPDNAVANLALAHLQLLTGDFEAGWAGREARWQVPWLPITHLKFSQPMWLGEQSIEGKTILLYSDEGLGDAIQFARYVPMVAALGARVILVVQHPVQSLLAALPGVSQCLARSNGALPEFDTFCPMMSLPLAFKTRLETIPAGSYLPPPTEARRRVWEDRLGPHDRLRVGLVWSGNTRHMNDHNRSIPLQTLTRLLDVDATFVSLQKDPKPADRAVLLERTDIIDLTADLDDFAETAALVCCLDVVITVDTSVAHLAGALGCPTWILLPHTPDCRWLLDREDSPWYPTVRLFRQTETCEYASVLDRVRNELLARTSAFKAERK